MNEKIVELNVNHLNEQYTFDKIAKQSSGAVIYQSGKATLIAAVAVDPKPAGEDFLPLTVQYVEKSYAAALWFFRISLLVEIVLVADILFFLIYRYSYQTALIMYIGYQITFVFGSYLMRAETLLLQSDALLTKVDTVKQLGYLAGMGISYLFYTFLQAQGITQSQEQVYILHYLLLSIEVIVIWLILKSFTRSENDIQRMV